MARHNIFIFDLEGTLTNSSWRDHWARKGDWLKFESLMRYDPPNDVICDLARRLAKDNNRIIILTGKMDRGYDQAYQWLNSHNIKYQWMQMRKVDDTRPSKDYKFEYIQSLPREEIAMIFDDRKDIIKHLAENGYPTFYVKNSNS